MGEKDKISCIICAYNEEKRIDNVLRIVSKHPLINEVIVVDDGSVDNTSEVVKRYKKIKLIVNKENKGKTLSMLNGIKKAENELLLFLDADLVNLTNKNISDLILPVLNKEVDITLSLRKNSLGIMKLIGLDFVTGERFYNKNIIKGYEKLLNTSNFSFETNLNKIIIEKKLKLKSIKLSNLSHVRKAKKEGFFKGSFNDFKMGLEIIKILGFIGMFKMNKQLLALRIK